MPNPSLSSATEPVSMFRVVRASDPSEFDLRSRVSDRLPAPSRCYRYLLQDRALWRRRFQEPIFSLAIRGAGPIVATSGESRFATEVSLSGEPSDLLAFSIPLHGRITWMRGAETATVGVSQGLVYLPDAGTRLVTSDDSQRANVFLRIATIEAMLEHMLDTRLRAPLEFRPTLDWEQGLAASLKRQLHFVMEEFARPDGIADNAVALAATTDLLASLVLSATSHSYSERLRSAGGAAAPAHVTRAEDFMRAHCTEPLRVADLAAAAGCSVRTLSAAFRRFRGRTPLAALHGTRLDGLHAELSRGATEAPVAAIARRYGFTNGARLAAAFRRRFGETPREVVRRASGPLAPR